MPNIISRNFLNQLRYADNEKIIRFLRNLQESKNPKPKFGYKKFEGEGPLPKKELITIKLVAFHASLVLVVDILRFTHPQKKSSFMNLSIDYTELKERKEQLKNGNRGYCPQWRKEAPIISETEKLLWEKANRIFEALIVRSEPLKNGS